MHRIIIVGVLTLVFSAAALAQWATFMPVSNNHLLDNSSGFLLDGSSNKLVAGVQP